MVSTNFGKRYTNVLRAYDTPECSQEFNRLHFEPVTYIDSKGEQRRRVGMTEEGFSVLVMGFTGRTAAVWKERYLLVYQRMRITSRASAAPAPGPARPGRARRAAENGPRIPPSPPS